MENEQRGSTSFDSEGNSATNFRVKKQKSVIPKLNACQYHDSSFGALVSQLNLCVHQTPLCYLLCESLISSVCIKLPSIR